MAGVPGGTLSLSLSVTLKWPLSSVTGQETAETSECHDALSALTRLLISYDILLLGIYSQCSLHNKPNCKATPMPHPFFTTRLAALIIPLSCATRYKWNKSLPTDQSYCFIWLVLVMTGCVYIITKDHYYFMRACIISTFLFLDVCMEETSIYQQEMSIKKWS